MKILFLSRWYPYPPDNGSKIRVYNLIKQLAAQHEVTLLSFVDPADGSPQPLPGRLCAGVSTTPWHPYRPTAARALFGVLSPRPRSQVATYSSAMAKMVAGTLASADFDVVICSQLDMAEYARGCAPIPAVLEELEIGAILGRNGRRPPALQRVRLQLTKAKLRAYLRRLLPLFAACTVVSETERQLITEVVPGYSAVHVLPNAVDCEALVPDGTVPSRNTLIYPGALTYSANHDAMRYFLAECYPRIRCEVPDIRLIITGRNDGVAVEQLALDAGVSLTGYLPDVRPLLRQSWACVVPLRVGGGTRIKILEAMALGTPVVSTTKGAEGLEMTDGTHLLLADTPEYFARRTVELLRQPKLRAHLVSQARELVVRCYSWVALRPQLDKLLETALVGHHGRGFRERAVSLPNT